MYVNVCTSHAAILAVVATIITFSGTAAQNNPGPCTCDLTQSVCDISCCCDSDCTSEDILAFDTCLNAYSFASVQSCFPTAIMFRNYTPYTINTSSGNGLSCIYYDSFASRNYFTNPQVENGNITKLSLKAQAFASYNFSAINPAIDYSSYGSIYKAGNPIITIYNSSGNPSYLRQPSAVGGSQFCGYASPALFLVGGATACVRTVSSSSCTNDSVLDLLMHTTDFRVLPQPSLLTSNVTVGVNYTALTPVTQGSVTCLQLDGTAINCSEFSPSLTGSECNNVLRSLTYNIKYLPTSGIYEVTYNAVLAAYNVSSAYSLKQTFTLNFNLSTSSATPSSRSGNPGYLIGKPVLAGQRNSATGVITVNPDPNQWLTVPGALAASGGACNDASAASRSVAFGEDLLSSCSRQLTLTGGVLPVNACQDASSTVRNSLTGLGVLSDRVIGRNGNSVASVTTGWVQILVDNTSCAIGAVQQTATGCVNTLLGGRLDLLVAKAGSVTNPQNTLIGGRLRCIRGNVTFQCSAGSCLSGNANQLYLTSFAVNFFDTSSTPTSSLTAPKSIFEMRLIKNFFYLFYVESSAQSINAAPVSLLLCLACASYWLAQFVIAAAL